MNRDLGMGKLSDATPPSGMPPDEKPPARFPTSLGMTLVLLGGVHYGYNIAVVGAALPALRTSLANLRALEAGTLSSATLLGAVAGSPLSGLVCSRYGRRFGTVIGEACSTAGAIGCTLSSSVASLIAFRVIVGLGVGFCTLAKPIYVRETVCAQHVATVQASFAPAVAIGVLAAQTAGHVIASPQWLFLLGAVPPALLLAVSLLFMPESPEWLSNRRRALGESKSALSRPQDAGASVGTWLHVRIAVWLAVANQLTGAYPTLVYAPELVHAAYPASSPSSVPLLTTFFNFIGACAAVHAMGACRRRPLVIGALLCEAVCLMYTAYLSFQGAQTGSGASTLPLALSLSIWCLAYQLGPGSGYFVLVGDIALPPMDTAVFAIGNSVRYTCEFASSLFFLPAATAFGVWRVLLFHAMAALTCATGLVIMLPETNPHFGHHRPMLF